MTDARNNGYEPNASHARALQEPESEDSCTLPVTQALLPRGTTPLAPHYLLEQARTVDRARRYKVKTFNADQARVGLQKTQDRLVAKNLVPAPAATKTAPAAEGGKKRGFVKQIIVGILRTVYLAIYWIIRILLSIGKHLLKSQANRIVIRGHLLAFVKYTLTASVYSTALAYLCEHFDLLQFTEYCNKIYIWYYGGSNATADAE